MLMARRKAGDIRQAAYVRLPEQQGDAHVLLRLQLARQLTVSVCIDWVTGAEHHWLIVQKIGLAVFILFSPIKVILCLQIT